MSDFLNRLTSVSESMPLAHARALDGLAYSAAEMPGIEAMAVFRNSWQYVTHESRIPVVGDYVLAEIAGVPLLVIRDSESSIRCLVNVCKHRAGPLATEDGNVRKLRCQYHGWTYDLAGQLILAPEMDSSADFDPCDVHLDPVTCESWQGFVFVHLGAHVGEPPVSVEMVFEGIQQQIKPIDLTQMSFHHRHVYSVNCQWKVYMDNYLEGYHLPYVHPGLSKMLDYRQYDTDLFDWYSYQYSPIQSGQGIYGEGQAHYYCVYPNLMLNILPGRCQLNLVIPTGPDTCDVYFDYFYQTNPNADTLAMIEQDQAFSDEIQQEDITICERVQKGLASGTYQPGRLCTKREQGVWHFQELIRSAYRQWLTSASDN